MKKKERKADIVVNHGSRWAVAECDGDVEESSAEKQKGILLCLVRDIVIRLLGVGGSAVPVTPVPL